MGSFLLSVALCFKKMVFKLRAFLFKIFFELFKIIFVFTDIKRIGIWVIAMSGRVGLCIGDFKNGVLIYGGI
jgi:hypothetical protein